MRHVSQCSVWSVLKMWLLENCRYMKENFNSKPKKSGQSRTYKIFDIYMCLISAILVLYLYRKPSW